MAQSLRLLTGSVTLSEALAKDEDILAKLAYPRKRYEFYMRLYNDVAAIKEIVCRHLTLPESNVEVVGNYPEWLAGSFNLCIPVKIINNSDTTFPSDLLVRFPLPYKVGEELFPGNVEEKLRCEAATYIWLNWNCPTIPVPRLFGFGLPGGDTFTPIGRESPINKMLWMIRATRAWQRGTKLPPFFKHNRSVLRDVGYLIIEFAQGHALYPTWDEHEKDLVRRANLYRGLSKMMLVLSRRSLPRIGALVIDARGELSLSNRPLTLDIHETENYGIPSGISRSTTYNNADSYYMDLLNLLDNTLRDQPNSVHDREDGINQVAALASLRLMSHHFVDRELRNGPFIFTLTDFHQSNIFVDDKWNIISIIDLEWACVRPIQMLGPPKWLSDHLLDELARDTTSAFEDLHNSFVQVFAEEEQSLYNTNVCTNSFRKNWKTGAYWFFRALDSSPNLVYSLVQGKLSPLFRDVDPIALEHVQASLARLWTRDVPTFLLDKVKEQEEYYEKTRTFFTEELKRLEEE